MSRQSTGPIRVERALNALYHASDKRPVVTYVFLVLCYLITIPTLFYPDLYAVFGGIEPRQHWWQLITAVFEHGWPGFHGSIHLALNTFLILECGRPCERLLGSSWFLVLCLLSLAANAFVMTLTGGVNGSSLIIWAWGPPLFVAVMWAKQAGVRISTNGYQRIRGILILMYVIVALAMAFVPYLFGFRGNILTALIQGNLYHLVATAVGAAFAAIFGGYIRRRIGG